MSSDGPNSLAAWSNFATRAWAPGRLFGTAKRGVASRPSGRSRQATTSTWLTSSPRSAGASDRGPTSGGKGGKDLWISTRKGKGGTFGRPLNLGPEINTPGDEMFPYLRDDSTLYFASNGQPGMGGLDIFRSVRAGGKWSIPENMKYPINSSGDDFGMVFNLDEPEEGYLTSNRPGGKGKDDIYSFLIPPVYFTLEGTVTDDRTLQPVGGAKVRIVGTNGKTAEYTTDGAVL